ncbi:MAG: hypothetical protein D6698_12900 [Gammaproteobacteria bacterium]|nr:MAG: hypothetical protein D6698_12900 [Gammaproteobacteria bacterium]
MKKIIAMVSIFMVSAMGDASAQVISSTSGNGDIRLSWKAGPDMSLMVDVNGDGRSNYAYPELVKSGQPLFGPADKKGMSRLTLSEWNRDVVKDGQTGRLLYKTPTFMHVLQFDVYNPPNPGPNQGFQGGSTSEAYGIFTVGKGRFVADMRGADGSWGAMTPFYPYVRGSKYIDGTMSVAILNAKTGKLVKHFVVQSNPNWSLDIYMSGFADVNGITRFVEVFHLRPSKAQLNQVPAPGKPIITKGTEWIRIWNYNHTKLVSSYKNKRTWVQLP